jgi:hypothetical protein
MMFPPPFDGEPPPTPEEREAIWTVNQIIIAFLAGGAAGGLLVPHQMIPRRLGASWACRCGRTLAIPSQTRVTNGS